MGVILFRNFAIISHIDHGKSTLADRLMEATGLLPPLPPEKRGTPRIDRMELEVERGVTIKLKAVRLIYSPQDQKSNIKNQNDISKFKNTVPQEDSKILPFDFYILNLIDTPGHADFSYEVSRSLAACEGVLLLVDATQGPQAQTVAHLEKARNLGLAVIGVINKIDSPLAQVEETEKEMRALGIAGEILKISALRGEGIEAVMEAVVTRISHPKGSEEEAFRALVFDSTYDEHLGVIAYARVVDGALKIKDQNLKMKNRIRFIGTGVEASVKEIGFFTLDRKATTQLSAGEVGYIATGLKDPRAVQVGDTVTLASQLLSYQVTQLPGYKKPQSFVFASFFPATTDFSELKEALNRLRLEEPAISIEEISSPAFGRGFKLGFLGTFHLEIVKERLEREFDLELVVTKPTVAFKWTSGRADERTSRQLDKETNRLIDKSSHPIIQSSSRPIAEPWIKVTIITPPEYLPGAMKLITGNRGKVGEVTSFGAKVRLSAELPLMEFIKDFYDQLKSLSSGYASLDWEFLGYRPADLVRLDIAVHNEVAEGLSEIVLKDQAQKIGREKVKKLKELMPRQQFAYAIQAKVATPATPERSDGGRGGKVLAREDVPALRKDVTAPLYGGDVTRKRKLLEKQKKGKKRLAKFGRVEVPPEAFLV